MATTATTMVLLLLSLLVLPATATTAAAAAAAVLRVIRVLVRRRHGLAALQVDVDAARVLLGAVLEPQLAAHLLDAGLELLHVVHAVVALADDPVVSKG